MRILTIVIPTYNRKDYVIKNIRLLKQFIANINAETEIDIVVSDNNSEDNTYEELIKQECDNMYVYKQEKNIGLEENVLFCLKKAQGKYVMLLGDDDYIFEEYLYEVLNLIKRNLDLKVIIPNNYPIDEDGEKIRGCRDKEEENRYVFKSFKDKCEFLLKAHQISGITLLREGSYERYMELEVSNLYPQIFLAGENMKKGECVHITKYPVRVTSSARKYWKYTSDELMDDILNNFKKLFINRYISRVYAEIILFINYKNVINRCIGRNTFEFLKCVLLGKNSSLIFKTLVILKTIFNYLPIQIKKYIKIKKVNIIKNSIEGKNVVVFSASAGGRMLNHILKSNSINADYVCDNNENLFNTSMQGIKINSINKLLEEISSENIIVFIGSKTYEDQIEEQLLKLKIDKSNILKYNAWKYLEYYS